MKRDCDMANLLRISPEAVNFIKSSLFRGSEEKALVIVGVVRGTVRDWDNRASVEGVVEMGSEAIRNLPSRITVDYQLNTTDLKHLPQDDVYVVNGVKCYLPDEIQKIVGLREVVLVNGRLQFEPTLEPQDVERGT
jgi:hypothetical protein